MPRRREAGVQVDDHEVIAGGDARLDDAGDGVVVRGDGRRRDRERDDLRHDDQRVGHGGDQLVEQLAEVAWAIAGLAVDVFMYMSLVPMWTIMMSLGMLSVLLRVI